MLSHCAGVTHLAQSEDGCLNQVVGVRRTLRLGQNVFDANALEHGTHSATGYHTGTLRCGEDDDLGTTEVSGLLVGHCTFDDGNLDQVLLGSFHTFGNGGGNFAGFTKTVADDSFAITDYNDSGECEGTTTLGNFYYTIDSNESIL